MKKILMGIIFAGLIVFLNYSCKKETNLKNASNNIPTFMSNNDIHLRNIILNFRNNISKHYKTGSSLTIDSSIWYIETTINYTYSWDNFEFIPISVDSLIYTLPLDNNGEVLQSDVDSIYSLIVNDLGIIYDTINANIKHLVVTDVFLTNTNNNSANIQVNTTFGINPLLIYGSFDPEDDWLYGDDLGKCDHSITESDAAEEIEFKLNNPENPPQPPPGGYYYYDEIEYKDIWPEDWPNPNDNIPNDNMYDYLVFICYNNGWMPNYHECLPYNEMNFYLSGTSQVINNYSPDGIRPQGKTFISIDLIGTMVPSTPDYFILHMTENGGVKYGVQHITYDPPSDL